MAIIPATSCKIITCTILRVLPELDYVTGFKHLLQKIIEAKVEEKCFDAKSSELNDLIQLPIIIPVDRIRL